MRSGKLAFLRDRRALLGAVLTAIIAAYFLLGSRYPALDDKALMGADTRIEAIGFDTAVNVPAGASLVFRMGGNAVNWLYTNRRGMTFGIVLGAFLMALWPFFRQLHPTSRIGNTLVGMAVGAPMGLCVNCSTPVAHALYSAGARPETMLATMLSSPTLNVIVVSMSFALLPFSLAMVKLTTTLLVILVGVPLLTKGIDFKAGSATWERAVEGRTASWFDRFLSGKAVEDVSVDPSLGWAASAKWLFTNVASSLAFLIRTTVPLMILAGVLGAALITVLPFEGLARLVPAGGGLAGLAGLLFVSALGVFLPVPMAFDVIVSAVLLNAGMPIPYVACLLFTLGIFSVYPFSVIWRISRPGALTLAITLVALGVVSGKVGSRLHREALLRDEQFLREAFSRNSRPPEMPRSDRSAQPFEGLLAKALSSRLIPSPAGTQGNIAIGRTPFANSGTQARAAGGVRFERLDGSDLGLRESENDSFYRLDDTLGHVRGVAAGDINRDGWPDLAFSSDAGIGVYLNIAGQRFEPLRLEIPEIESWFIMNVALVDLDNDGWLDLFFSTFGHGTYVAYNRRGVFSADAMAPLPNTAGAMSQAPAFGDLDRDGVLEVVMGNVATGKVGGHLPPLAASRSAVLRRTASGYRADPLPGPVGETLTSALSDIDGDGFLDLILGRDFDPPDVFFRGDAHGELHLITRAEGEIPYSGATTMSVATADLDNDLIPEIYIGQISRAEKHGGLGKGRRMSPREICAEHPSPARRSRCESFWTWIETTSVATFPGPASRCLALTQDSHRDACLAQTRLAQGRKSVDPSACGGFPAGWEHFAALCRAVHGPTDPPTLEEREAMIPQVSGRNILLHRTAAGPFADGAAASGLREGGTTWNARFADLDNDGWQDLYVASGRLATPIRDPAYLYMNRQGRFDDVTEPSGLLSFLGIVSSVYVDYDNDGDLDIVAVPAVGPVIVYRNDSPRANAIRFNFEDSIGNRFGIGTRIVVRHGAGLHQMREIQASGGYSSFDPPEAHFGLGASSAVDQVEVRWSTGEESVLKGPFAAGATYTISRGVPAKGRVQ